MFDAADRLTAIADTKGKRSLFSATYARDNANQLASDSSAPSSTSAYKYTTLNQVCYAGSSSSSACSSPPSGSTAYAYDAADNLTQIGGTQQAFNNADELCWTAATSGTCAPSPSGATRYAYDARGNRVTVTPPVGGATNLSYDQANRLTGYSSTTAYAYNGDGLRMSKTVSGTTSQFLWDLAASPPILLKDGTTAYVYGSGGLPLEQINGSMALWLHHDQVGSTRLVTDGGGVSQATYTFDAYGTLTASTGSIANPFRFTGEYWDSESNLYYLRARYYDPNTGQFLSRDPAVEASSDPYGYVKDNPLNRTDPTGLCDFWDFVCQARQKAAKTFRAAATVTGFIHDHATVGLEECVLACVDLKLQAGRVELSGGAVGWKIAGPYVGLHTLPADQRQAWRTTGGGGFWAAGLTGSVGYDPLTDTFEPHDLEVSVSLGCAGGKIATTHTIWERDIPEVSW